MMKHAGGEYVDLDEDNGDNGGNGEGEEGEMEWGPQQEQTCCECFEQGSFTI